MAIPLNERVLRANYDAYCELIKVGYCPMGKGKPSAVEYLSKKLDVAHGTLRNRLIKATALWGDPDWEPDVDDAGVDPIADVVEKRNTQDEIRDYKKRIADLERQLVEAVNVGGVIQHMAGQSIQLPKWLKTPFRVSKPEPHVAMTMWADWHAGEVVDRKATHGINEYNSEIMEQRVHRLIETTIELCEHHGPGDYSGAVVMLVGDMVSGALHSELAKTDDEEVIPACLRVAGLLTAGLTRMADYFGNVYVPCVPGNHGRNTPKPEYKRHVENSFDWLIYNIVARELKNDKRITFDIPQAGECLFKVYNTRYFLTHGDMLGTSGGDGIIGALGPIMRGAFKVGRQQAALGQDFDVMCIGHWHQSLALQDLIVSNTLKGFDEYASKKLRAKPSLPSQPLWFVHPRHGRVSFMEVYLEDRDVQDSDAWVSLPAA